MLRDIALVRLWLRQAKVVGACGGKAGGAAWVVAVTCRALGDIVTLQAKLVDARAAVVEEREALRAGLARRQAVAQARALLELMQATAHAMSKARAPACLPGTAPRQCGLHPGVSGCSSSERCGPLRRQAGLFVLGKQVVCSVCKTAACMAGLPSRPWSFETSGVHVVRRHVFPPCAPASTALVRSY